MKKAITAPSSHSSFPDYQARARHQQRNPDGPFAVQGDRAETEQSEMVQEDAGGQLGADNCCQCRCRADSGDGNDGHGDKKGAEAAAGELPPGTVHDTLEGAFAGDQHHDQEEQGADGKGDAGVLQRADLLGQTPVDGGLHSDGDTAAEHQDKQQDLIHPHYPLSYHPTKISCSLAGKPAVNKISGSANIPPWR